MEIVDTRANDRFAGLILAAAALLSVFAMAHHPSGTTGHGGLAQLVHGAMMIVVLALFAGFSRYCMRRGLDRFWVHAGLVAFGAGAVGNLMAATINGFAVPALAARGASEDVFHLCWELNQAFAYGAVYATSIAFILWGADALLGRPRGARWLGVAGLLAGLAPVALLGGQAIGMDVAGAFIVYAVQSAFALIVGVHLVRGRY